MIMKSIDDGSSNQKENKDATKFIDCSKFSMLAVSVSSLNKVTLNKLTLKLINEGPSN